MNHQELREEVVEISRRMGASELVVGTSGNISILTPEGDVLVTPSALDYEEMKPEDVVLVNMEGKALEGSLSPSSETPMHIGVYRARTGVGAIVHTHSPFSTILACLGWEIPTVHYLVLALSDEGRVPVAPYETPNTEELARRASEALGDSHYACLLQNHGTITVGETLSEAYSRTERLEEMAMIYYRTRLAGDPLILTPEQATQVAPKVSSYIRSTIRSSRGKSSF
jgi:L-fuculose-phosphate aldolase